MSIHTDITMNNNCKTKTKLIPRCEENRRKINREKELYNVAKDSAYNLLVNLFSNLKTM